jgi:hypothetical protein
MYEIPMFYQTPIDMKIKQKGISFADFASSIPFVFIKSKLFTNETFLFVVAPFM